MCAAKLKVVNLVQTTTNTTTTTINYKSKNKKYLYILLLCLKLFCFPMVDMNVKQEAKQPEYFGKEQSIKF